MYTVHCMGVHIHSTCRRFSMIDECCWREIGRESRNWWNSPMIEWHLFNFSAIYLFSLLSLISLPPPLSFFPPSSFSTPSSLSPYLPLSSPIYRFFLFTLFSPYICFLAVVGMWVLKPPLHSSTKKTQNLASTGKSFTVSVVEKMTGASVTSWHSR